ncbi:tol-pal system protein YbgF [Syntrophus gentianae]|uniref:Tol-pal system protein YbgF n=1 Tax=Syntrophus gentianae TaxID=43775 RepID=A0A1H7YP55_9BACT|nr:tol-pal system protein YbgF [Syntrophus gentianae]SEM47088.1 tol-pal system protein YbgF [Syntrophus gentianae]
MKTLKLLAVVTGLMIFSGCATSSELNRTSAELNSKIGVVNDRVTATDANISALKKEVDSNKAVLEGLRKSHANSGADLTELREQVQQLRGQVESLRKEIGGGAGRGGHDETREKLDQLAQKVNFLETFLAIGDKNSHAASTNGTKAKETAKPKTARDDQYAAAYVSFKEGKYEKARNEFQSFLKSYPKTSYSDNAQFWIGETYYFEKKYEKAILEYDKVVKGYPNGNKAANALFKQGLCFTMLGDKASARLIFQQVIKNYPNTSQARTARAKLLEIK